MKPRSIRSLALSGSLLFLAAVSVLIVRFLLASSNPAPVEEPAHSEDDSEVLLARTAGPAAVDSPKIPEPVGSAIAGPPASGPAHRAGAMGASGTSVPGTAPHVAGMVIGLDPETGAWGPPTPEQLRELAEIRRRTPGDEHRVAKPDGHLPEVHHPDGHVSVDLNGQFQEFVTVRIGPDGKPVFTCMHGPEDAERAVPEPSALEER